jgi:hypothetical protein
MNNYQKSKGYFNPKGKINPDKIKFYVYAIYDAIEVRDINREVSELICNVPFQYSISDKYRIEFDVRIEGGYARYGDDTVGFVIEESKKLIHSHICYEENNEELDLHHRDSEFEYLMDEVYFNIIDKKMYDVEFTLIMVIINFILKLVFLRLKIFSLSRKY